MPTGYTAAICEGITFKEFATHCAHAFIWDMREEPYDAELPSKREPSNYHKEEYEKAEAELKRLKAMSLDEAEKLSDIDYKKEIKGDKEYGSSKRSQKNKYEAMLKQVEAWEPPTKEHNGIKKFMIDQIKSSIEFDCSERDEPEKQKPDGLQWRAMKIKKAVNDIKYHKDEYKKEVERVNHRNEWVRKFKESLNNTPKTRFDNIV